MKFLCIAESFRLGSSHTSGFFRVRLRDQVRTRYRKPGTEQDCYEIVIDAKATPKVRRARKNGTLASFLGRLRYGSFTPFAVVTNQPAITSLLPSLIAIDDDRLAEADVWQLLAYAVEWKVESAERFYLHFLRNRSVVSELDVLTAIAGEIRTQVMDYLQTVEITDAGAFDSAVLTREILDEYIVPLVNQRIAHTGVTIRRLHPPASQARAGQEILGALACLFQNESMPSAADTSDQEMRSTLVDGLLNHLCQELGPDHQWIERIVRNCGHDLSFEELQKALAGTDTRNAPSRVSARRLSWPAFPFKNRRRDTATQQPLYLPPALVIQRLVAAGREQIRLANQTTPQEMHIRHRLRRKALSFLQFALLLSESPRLASSNSGLNARTRIELLALMATLDTNERKHSAEITLPSGSTVNLIAVAAESESMDDGPEDFQLVQEILPLHLESGHGMSEPVTVWTPAAAADTLHFAGTGHEISLMLQVLEPPSAGDAHIESLPPILFWNWRIRSAREQFSVRLRPTKVATRYEIELQNAEFVDFQPVRSSEFPIVPHMRPRYEPLELALLLDGYWLAAVSTVTHRTGLDVLVELLDAIDDLENRAKSGLLIHAAICLDEHISPEFTAKYGEIPALFTLGDDPVETAAQLVAEWLQPWVERWNRWETKPYPVDTDIALEKGFHYLRQLRWQRATRPEQRAVVVVGRSRPHDHAKYFVDTPNHESRHGPLHALHATGGLDTLEVPYHPQDRFSVTNIDWRDELQQLRAAAGTILALCEPGMPNPRYELPATHTLLREYQAFWAEVDQGTLLDISDPHAAHCAEMGIGRVLETLQTNLFQRRTLRHCEPPLALPFSQVVPVRSEQSLLT